MEGMKRFHYIDENEEEQLDLIALFEYALDYKVNFDDIAIALSILEKHIELKALIEKIKS